MDKRKHYSQREKFAALAALERNGGNRYQTAKEIGIPHTTLSRWIKEAEQSGELPQFTTTLVSPEDEEGELDERLERVAWQMVAIMPQKVEEANLQELARSLAIILASMNQARASKEQSGDVYEKLARLMARYAPNRPADGDVPPPDGD